MVSLPKIVMTWLMLGAIGALSAMGVLQPLDNGLRDLRFAADERHPAGGVVFLDIDARALEAVGVWPWPRRVHAEITDRLLEMGAAEVAFDVDFSVASNETDDALFEAALERAGGYALLAAFRQHGDGSTGGSFNLPLARFGQHANPASVNVEVEGSGMVRRYPYAVVLGDATVPSLASALTQLSGPPDTSFLIDFSIDPAGIDRISAAELLAGNVDPARIENRQVVVGASALELRDFFVIPVHGVVPGGMLQILATETLLQGRVLVPLGSLPIFGLILVIGTISLLLRGRRVPLSVSIALAALAAVLIEAAALWLQAGPAMLLDSAALHINLAVLVLAAIAHEVGRVRRLHRQASRERDATRIVLDHVIADNFDGVVVVEDTGRIIAASQLAAEFLGAGLRGRLASDVLPGQLDAAVTHALTGATGVSTLRPTELALLQPSGERRHVEYAVTISTIDDRAKGGAERRVACLTFRDIGERRRHEEKLRHLADHDPLTGALSRLKLVELIEAELADGTARTAGVSVILLDLGRFKTVNDTLGHSFGDMVLKQVVERMLEVGADAVARLGGDSFAILLKGRRSDEALRHYCDALLRRITEPYKLSGRHQALVAASAGGTHSDLSGNFAEVLLSHADMALAAAKSLPGSHFEMFAPEMEERLKEKRDMEIALRQALERGEFSIRYQPQVDLPSGELVGVEALVRWEHPTLGVVSPAKFIPAAEETGQIVELGRWVLQAACREVASWPEATRLAVNVSPIQFELADVAAEVRQALEASGLPAHRLDIEITEGVFLSRSGAVTQSLQQVRDLGVGVALDDFGTGYSSLGYLGRLPVDKIKIDQSFVMRLPGDVEAEAIVRAVLNFCDALDKSVIAEGIETIGQSRMLQKLGCRTGQGYYYSRPRSVPEMMQWFAERSAPLRSVGS